MHDDMTFNAWKVLQRSKELDQRPKRAQAQPNEPFLIQTEWLFGMSVSWEVRWGLEEWEPKMHIVKELRALNIFFNNMLFSLKNGLLF